MRKFWLTFCMFTVDSRPDAQHGVHDQKPERHERYEVVELVGPVHGHTQQHHQEVEAKQDLIKHKGKTLRLGIFTLHSQLRQ